MATREMPHVPLERELAVIVSRLEERFHEPHDKVEDLVRDSADRLLHAPVQQFVALLAEKRAAEALRAARHN